MNNARNSKSNQKSRNRIATSLATFAVVAAGLGVTGDPAMAEVPSEPTKVTASPVGATVKAPKPVQALETWTDVGSRVLNVSYKTPTTGPADYLVEVVNVTTNKVIWSQTTQTAFADTAPLTTPALPTGNLVVRVTASNAGGKATAARAMIDGKIGPVSMLRSAWIGSGTNQQLQLTWNPPNYSDHSHVTKYGIYGATGMLITTVNDDSATLTVAQSANVQGAVEIRPIADDGTVGTTYRRTVGTPVGTQSVTIADGPSVAAGRTDYTITATTTGYGDGAAAKLLVEADGVWNEVAAGTVTNSQVSLKTQFTGLGVKSDQNYQIVVTDGVTEKSSATRTVSVYDPSVTAAPTVTTTISGERYLLVNATTRNVAEGTEATIAVKAPGQGTFKTVGTAPVAADGTIAYAGANADTLVPAAGGAYSVRIVLAPAAAGLPAYTSPEVSLQAPAVNQSVTVTNKAVEGTDPATRVLKVSGKANGFTAATPVKMTITDPTGKTSDAGSTTVTDAAGSYELSSPTGLMTAPGNYTFTITAGTGATAKTVTDTVAIAAKISFTTSTGVADGGPAINFEITGSGVPVGSNVTYTVYSKKQNDSTYTLATNGVFNPNSTSRSGTVYVETADTYDVKVEAQIGTETTPSFSQVQTVTVTDPNLGPRTLSAPAYKTLTDTTNGVTTRTISATGSTTGYNPGTMVTLFTKAPGNTTYKSVTTTVQADGSYSFDAAPGKPTITPDGRAWSAYVRVGSYGTRTVYSPDTQYLPDGSQTVTLTSYANIVASTNYDYTFAGTTQQISDGASAKLLVEKTPGVWTEAGSGTVNANAFSFKARLTGNGAQNFKVVITDGASEISTKTYAVTVYDPIVAATATVATNASSARYIKINATTQNIPAGTVATVQIKTPGQTTFTNVGTATVGADGKIAYTAETAALLVPFNGGTYTTRITIPPLANGLVTYTSPEASVQVPVGTVTVTPSVASNASNNRYLRVNATTQFVPAGTVATVQVKAPGQSTFTDAGTATVAANGKIAFTTENAATQIAFEGGQYAARVVIPSLGSGLDAYTSPEGSVQAAAGSISVQTKSTVGSGTSRGLRVTGSAQGYPVGTTITATITDSSGKTSNAGTTTTGTGGYYQLTSVTGLMPTLGDYTFTLSAGSGSTAKSITDTVTAVNPLTLTAVNGTLVPDASIGSGYVGGGAALTFDGKTSGMSEAATATYRYRKVGTTTWTTVITMDVVLSDGTKLYRRVALPQNASAPGTYEMQIVVKPKSGDTTEILSDIQTMTITDLGARSATATYKTRTQTKSGVPTLVLTGTGSTTGYAPKTRVVMYAKAPGASSFSIAGVSVTNADGTYDFVGFGTNAPNVTVDGQAWQVYVTVGNDFGWETTTPTTSYIPS